MIREKKYYQLKKDKGWSMHKRNYYNEILTREVLLCHLDGQMMKKK